MRDIPDDGHDLPDFQDLTEKQEFGPPDLEKNLINEAAGRDFEDLDPQCDWRQLLNGVNQDNDRFAKLFKQIAAR